MHHILVINVGSTSVKTALFAGEKPVASARSALQGTEENRLPAVRAHVADFLAGNRAGPVQLTAIAARGGLLRPVESGVYRVDAAMLRDLEASRYGEHPANLSARVAAELAREAGIPAYVVDPPTVDEMNPPARITGVPSIRRRSVFHALSQKAAGRKAADELGRPYASLHLIVVHMGGGISVAAHSRGRVIDVNNALDGDGPIAPERAGTMPAADLAAMCFRGDLDKDSVRRMLTGQGGMRAHLGTSDMHGVEKRICDGDDIAGALVEAMAYTVAKQIGAMSAVLAGSPDAIVITGGLAAWERLVSVIKQRTAHLGQILVYPENLEMPALALGVLRVLRKQEPALAYGRNT